MQTGAYGLAYMNAETNVRAERTIWDFLDQKNHYELLCKYNAAKISTCIRKVLSALKLTVCLKTTREPDRP
jgi:hypothetical protein